jgi:hypothetical protein
MKQNHFMFARGEFNLFLMVLKGILKTFLVIVALETEFFHLKYVRKSFKGTLVKTYKLITGSRLDSIFFAPVIYPGLMPLVLHDPRRRRQKILEVSTLGELQATCISKVGFAPDLKRGVPKTL